MPLVLTTIAGWVGLSQLVKDKLDVHDAQRTYDERAPVEKQRAKSFDLEQELERIREHHLDRKEEYVNKGVPR